MGEGGGIGGGGDCWWRQLGSPRGVGFSSHLQLENSIATHLQLRWHTNYYADLMIMKSTEVEPNSAWRSYKRDVDESNVMVHLQQGDPAFATLLYGFDVALSSSWAKATIFSGSFGIPCTCEAESQEVRRTKDQYSHCNRSCTCTYACMATGTYLLQHFFLEHRHMERYRSVNEDRARVNLDWIIT
jgi:hypothetical protein